MKGTLFSTQHIIIMIVLACFLVAPIYSYVYAKDTNIKSINILNKYGFDTWALGNSECKKIKKSLFKHLRKCVAQGKKRTSAGKHTQYKCLFKNKSRAGEFLIYSSRKVCTQVLNATYLEGN